eukprot:TRINITY_DN9585_c0_g1_i1.p2 TRINITY_DN9585_c0_g1~~TRINITY_DN9585_c0_g1_i1.p2  ORF type:complete len:117 (-),score=12.28 TRINITY_DN9585_c0_g1_i1:63-413(-)
MWLKEHRYLAQVHAIERNETAAITRTRLRLKYHRQPLGRGIPSQLSDCTHDTEVWGGGGGLDCVWVGVLDYVVGDIQVRCRCSQVKRMDLITTTHTQQQHLRPIRLPPARALARVV